MKRATLSDAPKRNIEPACPSNMTGSSRYPSAWAAIALACALGITLYLVAVALERIVMPWNAAREAGR